MNDNFPVGGSFSALLVLGVSSCETLGSAIINMLKYYIWNLFIQEQLNIIHDLPHLFHSDDYFGTNNLCPNYFSQLKIILGQIKIILGQKMCVPLGKYVGSGEGFLIFAVINFPTQSE